MVAEEHYWTDENMSYITSGEDTSKDQNEKGLICEVTLSEAVKWLCVVPDPFFQDCASGFTCYSQDKQGGSIINTQRTVEMFCPHVLHNTPRSWKWDRIHEKDLWRIMFTQGPVSVFWCISRGYHISDFYRALVLVWGHTGVMHCWPFTCTLNILERLHTRQMASWNLHYKAGN